MSEWDNLPLTDEDVKRKVDALSHECYVLLDKRSIRERKHNPADTVRMKAMKTTVANLKPLVKDFAEKSFLADLAVCEEVLDSLMMKKGPWF